METRSSSRRKHRRECSSVLSDEASLDNDRAPEGSKDPSSTPVVVGSTPQPLLHPIQEANDSFQNVGSFLEFGKIPPSKVSTPNFTKGNKSERSKELFKEITGFYESSIISTGEKDRENTSTGSFIAATEFFGSQSMREDIPSDYFSGSDTPRKLRDSTKRLSLEKPQNSYIAYSSDEELEEWWDQPKTDYTYSASLTYRECVTPDRQISSPNMSRRGVRRANHPHVSSPPFSESSWNSLDLRGRNVPRRAYSTFSDESGDEADAVSIQQHQKESHSSKRHTSQTTTLLTKRILSHGLDESDEEGGQFLSSTPVPQFAKPLVRRGTASLVVGSSIKAQFHSPEPYDPNSSYLESSNGIYRSNSQQQKLRWRDTFHSCLTTIQSSTLFLFFSSLFTGINSTALNSATRLYHYLSKSRSQRRHNATLEERQSLPIRAWSWSRTVFTCITTTITTTLVTTVTTIHKSTVDGVQRVLMVYESHRRQKPWLWSWLPLLLLLLLTLLFFGAYLWRRNDYPESSVLPTTPNLEASATLEKYNTTPESISGLFSKLKGAMVWLSSSVSFNFIKFCSIIQNFASFCFSFLKNLCLQAFQVTYSFVTFVLGSLTSLFPNSESLFNAVSNTSSVIRDGIHSRSQLMGSALSSVGAFMWDSVGTGAHFLYWILSSSGNAVLVGFEYVMHGIGLLFGAALHLLSSTCVFITSGCSTMASNIIMLFPGPSSKSEEVSLAPPLPTDHSSDTVIHLALQSVQFKTALSKEVELQINSLREQLKASERDDAKLLQQIDELKSQSEELYAKVEEMSRSHGMEKDSRLELSNMIGDISSTIKSISSRLDEADSNHQKLVKQVKSCCQKPLSLEDVERHIKTIFSGLLTPEDGDTTQAQIEPIRLGSWLRTYFVAKKELEFALNNITDRFQSLVANESHSMKDLQEKTSNQSMKIIMDAINERIIKEIDLQKTQIASYRGDVDGATAEALSLIKREAAAAEQSIQRIVADEKQKRAEMSQFSQKELQEVGLQVKQDIEGNLTNVIQKILTEAFPESLSTIIAKAVREEVQKNMELKLEKKETASISHLDVIKNILPQAVAEFLSSNKTFLQGLFENNPSGGVVSNRESLGAHYNIDGTTTVNHASLIYNSGLNESTVQKIVREALLKYDADKTGLVDHALESAGGSIVSTRCTEGYDAHQIEWIILGISLFRLSTNDPRSVIQPGRMPGECWAFKGSEGSIVIQLAFPVQFTGFSLEHIPESLNPSGKIDSAPKDFAVYGLRSLNDEGTHIGAFQYVTDDDPLQYFKVKNVTDYFHLVELKIHSNHGNMQYTCIYRFRVHGNIAQVST